MRTYGQIQNQFWTSADICGLSDSAKLLAAYLLASEHTTAIGFFRLPVGYISADLEWPEDKVRKILEELSAGGFAKYCEDTGWVLIVKFLLHNKLQNENVVKGAVALMMRVPKTPCIYNDFLDSVKGFANGYERVSKWVGKQLRNPNPYPKPYPEPNPNPKPEPDIGAKAPLVRQSRTSVRFDEFWAQYPKKVDKKESVKAWVRAGLDNMADEIIADLISRKAQHKQWLDGFIPSPLRYLRNELWTDEIDTKGADNGKTDDRPGYQKVIDANPEAFEGTAWENP